VQGTQVSRLAIALLALGAVLSGAALPAGAARIQVGPLVLTGNGGFTPQALPRHRYAPIEFQAHADVKMSDGSVPPAVQRIRLAYDRDGRLTTAGLPVCAPAKIEAATTRQARSRCRSAIVGSGHLGAEIALPGLAPVQIHAPLTLFNGPREGGDPVVLVHTRATYPTVETFVVPVRIEPAHGPYSYRTDFAVPQLADGYGSLTHVDVKVGRSYRSGGRERSYVSARCSDYILQTHGLVSFADGTVISGDLFKSCRPL
jgi:hypothetical protein